MQKTYQLFIIALLSAIIFVMNFFVPPPISYLLIAVQAIVLALASFFVGTSGATYVGLVGGVLTALSRPTFGPFTFVFTFLFGVLVDVFFVALRVSAKSQGVNRNRTIVALTISTAIIGALSYYITAVYLGILDLTPMMMVLVVFVGMGSGCASGYAAAYLWNKYLKNIPV